MGQVLEAELIIKGSDKTGAAFAGVIKHAEQLVKAMSGMKDMSLNDPQLKQALADLKAQERVVRSMNSAYRAVNDSIRVGNRELEQRMTFLSRMREKMGGALGTAGMIAGPGIMHETKKSVVAGAELQSERVKMRAAGIPETEIGDASTSAYGLHAKYTNVGVATIMERWKELRSVLLHPGEVPHLIESVAKANAALNAVDRSGHMAEGLQFAVKGAEVLGIAQHPARFEQYLESFVKAQQVMGKTITPEQIFEFAKYSASSGAMLSDRFKMTTALSMSQELGGSRTGTGVDQFIKQVIGGFQGSQHAAAKEFVAMGLANKGDFEQTKTGDIKGFKPGKHVAGYKLASTDPDQWVYQYLIPALEAHGFKTEQEQLGQVRRMFTSKTSADIVSKLITQRESFANHAKLYEGASGFGAIGQNEKDPFVAFNSLTTSLESFAGTVTSPIMESAAQALSNISKNIAAWSQSLSEWQKKNPQLAEIGATGAVVGGAALGGTLTWNLLSNLLGTNGLKGSALALNESAAALTAAAGKIAIGGATGTAANAASAAAGGSGLLAGLSRWIPWIGGAVSIATTPDILKTAPGGKSWDDALRDYNVRQRPELERVPEGGLKQLHLLDLSDAKPAKAELTGQADVKVQVEVKPADGFWSSVKSMITNGINNVRVTGGAGSTGSTGGTMPEVNPHHSISVPH